jgi:hypothetical protein
MCQNDRVVTAPPLQPYINSYNGQNPLKIIAAPKRSDNYFLIIGDWGKSGGPGQCQKAVAAKMSEYVEQQRQEGKTPLAILSVGDNFYWAGVAPGSWDLSWGSVYGTNDPQSALFGIPWLATMGNHDFGDTDPYAFCADVNPLTTFDGQAYGCQQFNRDRNPTRPNGTELYWMPDYNFHYAIPEADVEFIFVDTNRDYVNHKIYSIGFHDARERCGGQPVVDEFLGRVRKAGEQLLAQRSAQGTASTTVILQHYPEHADSTRRIFLDGLNESGRMSSVLAAYGHVHDQVCTGRDENGNCDKVLTGGGGGCCLGSFGGFTAVHLTDDGGFVTDVESSRVRIPNWQCRI